MTWIADQYPGGSVVKGKSGTLAFKRAPEKGVIHTTETSGFPNYPANFEPHATVHPKARQWQQHIQQETAAYALKAPAGISTNTLGAIQVEIVGYAESLKDLSGDDLAYLIGFLDFFFGHAGIARQTSVTFVGGEGYGLRASQRLSASQWDQYKGWLGHQHVPGNSHWDPGAIPLQSWLGGGSTPPPVTPPPADNRPHNADGSLTIKVDGVRGEETVGRWQEVMGTHVDGFISKPESELIKADQRFLNASVASAQIQDLTGKPALDVDGDEGAKTIIVRQFLLRNWVNPIHQQNLIGHLLDFDGILGRETNLVHQFALNYTVSGSKQYGHV